MATVRLFAAAREAAGVTRAQIDGATVAEVLAEACVQFGEPFSAVLRGCKVWLNGEPVGSDAVVSSADEIAVLPPVSGG
jgi:molybdopterin synthase sulfur carrier subunit